MHLHDMAELAATTSEDGTALSTNGGRAVFVDKDGTLIENVPYNVDPARLRLLPGAAQGMRALSGAGYLLVVVSNQSGVARGYFPERALAGVETRLRHLLSEHGVSLAGFYYCPHLPEGTEPAYARWCACRKPRPGLLLRAAREHHVSLGASWLLGDILDDVEAGRRAGCRTILVDSGGETEWRLSPLRRPDFVVGSLAQAADLILHADARVLVG